MALLSLFGIKAAGFYPVPDNGRVKRPAGAVLFFLMPALAGAPPVGGERPSSVPGLGLAAELPSDSSAPEQVRMLDNLRRTGVSVFALSLSWSTAEPSPGTYRVAEIIRTARWLRQSGAVLHLDLPLVVSRVRDVPPDLAEVAFDDPKLSLRLGRLLLAIRPALLDFSTLSLGYEADAFFSDKPGELAAYRRLCDGAVQFLGKIAPNVKVGVTTDSPTESASPGVAALLHQSSPVLFYIYSPFAAGKPFFHRGPDALEADWTVLLRNARNRPIAFAEVSYSSAPENGSSAEKQAEFVRRFRRFLAAADGGRLLFARYAVWRDPPPSAGAADPLSPEPVRRRDSFFAHRGLQSSGGRPKPAWTEWVRAGR